MYVNETEYQIRFKFEKYKSICDLMFFVGRFSPQFCGQFSKVFNGEMM